MDYVMMPVPEGLTRDVEHFLMATDMRARAADRSVEIDAAAVSDLVRALSAPTRTLFMKLSTAALANTSPSVTELARAMQLNVHETIGLVQELSELVWLAFGPFMSVVITAPPDPKAGEIRWDQREVFVWKALAEAVVATPEPAERA